jgi:hypothetical protein
MTKTGTIFYNLGYWWLLYIPLTVAGFYVTYFSVISRPKPAIIHIHFGLMLGWMALVIAQPFLIKYKNVPLHRLLGKISYVFVPLVLLSGFAMLRFGYTNFTSDLAEQQVNGLPKFNRAEILEQGAGYILLAFFYIFWFAVLYMLGVLNKRKMHPHSRYMLATVLTLTGPTVDRVFFFEFGLSHVFGSVPAEYISFFLIDLVLAYLLYRDLKAGRNGKPLFTCLSIYVAGQVIYYLAPGTNWWKAIANFMMQ